MVEIAGEDIALGRIICLRGDGSFRAMRHDDRSDAIVGVSMRNCKKGEEISYLTGHDAIMEALQGDLRRQGMN